jgi:hypothetical protein
MYKQLDAERRNSPMVKRDTTVHPVPGVDFNL